MGSCVWSQGKDGREHKAQRAEVLAQEQEGEVESQVAHSDGFVSRALKLGDR